MTLNSRLTDWRGKVCWLVGASTGIGRATAAALHAAGAVVIVSARKAEALHEFATQHPGSDAVPVDVSNLDALKAATADIVRRHGGLDLVMFCAGTYKPQRATEYRLHEMLQHQEVNYVGALHLLDAVLPVLLKQAGSGPQSGPQSAPQSDSQSGRKGHISLVSSVAGYRGLPNALAYGPTKAALTHLGQALYLDLQDAGIGVSVVNPGFVETPLTAQNTFKMPALITPEVAAQEILKGWAAGDFEIHFPKRFTRWLKAMSHLPDTLYFRLVRKATGL
jgi:NAD(P)-dependent dehydrogenase (short-subunit alcohol dehydrogenase family)